MLITLGTMICIGVAALVFLLVFTIAVEERGWRFWLTYASAVIFLLSVWLFIHYSEILLWAK